MSLIELKGVSKYYDNRCLYRNVNLNINKGDKVVLLGENGVGKTTLFNIMLCETDVDTGKVKSETDKIIFLDQAFDFPHDMFVDQYVHQLFGEAIQLEKMVRSKAEELANDSSNKNIMREYIELSDKFEGNGGYAYLQEIERFVNLFGIDGMMGNRCRELSGGEKQYLRLAISLFSNKDIVFLDEPGSYLERDKISWLIDHIRSSDKTFVVISHDTHIVKNIASKVIKISDGEVNLYPYPYERYLEEERKHRARMQQSNKDFEKDIQRKIETVSKKIEWMRKAENKHRHAVTIKRMQREIEKLKREKVDFDRSSYSYEWENVKSETEKRLYITIDDIRKTYGGKEVLERCSLKIYSDSRLVIVGKNGSGKTTLLKVIMGEDIPEEGYRSIEHDISIEMVRQELQAEINSSIIDYCVKVSGKGVDLVESALYRLFDEKKVDINSSINLLSGGERKRLEILTKIISGPDLLLLDEPTVYMDQYSRGCLCDLIKDFSGAVLIVTHDDMLVDSLSMGGFSVLHMKNGRLETTGKEPYDL